MSLNACSDDGLLRQVAEGDQAAAGVLYDRYAPRLLGLIMRILPQQAHAEDALHEAFVYVLSRAAQFDAQRGAVGAWLTRVARSRAIDHLRRETRRRRLVSESSSMTPENPADVVELRERVDAAGAALSELAPEEREVVLLAFMGGLTHQEVSTRLSMPLGTVKTRIRRGVAELRDMLERDHHEH